MPPTQREYWNSKVGQEWANQADQMDRTLAPLTRAALERLALQRGMRVLDIGCGAAATSLAIAEQVGAEGRVVGVDISQQLLALGRERIAAAGANVELIDADAASAPLPGAPFDAAFSRFGVMFFDDPVAAFTKLRGDVRPGGALVFVCWRPFAENLWTFAPLEALKPLLTAPLSPPDPNAPGPFAFADAEKTRAILNAANWRDVAIAPWDGEVLLGADARGAAKFLLKIGPCARAVADQQIDPAAAEALLADYLTAHETAEGVRLAAACWIVSAAA